MPAIDRGYLAANLLTLGLNSGEAAAFALGSCGIIRDGVMVRKMTEHEHNAWQWLLYMGSQYGAEHVDEFQDRVCAAANRSESQSISYEMRGKHDDANLSQVASELFDHAATGFVVDALTGRR